MTSLHVDINLKVHLLKTLGLYIFWCTRYLAGFRLPPGKFPSLRISSREVQDSYQSEDLETGSYGCCDIAFVDVGLLGLLE